MQFREFVQEITKRGRELGVEEASLTDAFFLPVHSGRQADFAAMRQRFAYDDPRFESGAQDANHCRNPTGTIHKTALHKITRFRSDPYPWRLLHGNDHL